MRVLNHRLVQALISAIIILVTLVSINPSTIVTFQWCEAYANQIMLALLGFGLFFLTISQSRLMMLSFMGCAVLCLSLIERTQVPLKPAKQTSESIVRVANFNLSNSNESLDKTLELFLSAKAEVLSIQEITENVRETIDSFLYNNGYIYQREATDNSHFLTMGVYSKYPFESVQNVYLQSLPSIIGKVRLSEVDSAQTLTFVSSYIYPVFDQKTFEERQEYLKILSTRLATVETPTVTFGDFNTVSWSMELTKFKRSCHLNDSRRNIVNTSLIRNFSLFDIPIDHIFYSNHLKCISFETINSNTTTHLGIVGTYQFIKPTDGKNGQVKRTSQKL